MNKAVFADDALQLAYFFKRLHKLLKAADADEST